jgi:hypothetical protein
VSDETGQFEDELRRMMKQEVEEQLAGGRVAGGAGQALVAEHGRRRQRLRSVLIVAFVAVVTACSVAVVTLDGARPAPARHHGATPTSTTTPAVDGVSSDLDGVSCATPSTCVAVGAYFADVTASKIGVARGFSEVFTGTAWELSATPGVPGGLMTVLDAVSCPGPSICVAVGQEGEHADVTRPPDPFEDHASPLAEEWNGRRWALMNMPRVPNAYLAAVACPSTAECVAVGDVAGAAARNGEGRRLSELWRDGVWSQMTLPQLGMSTLEGVSCPSVNVCFAVGEQMVTVAKGRQGELPSVLRWEGGEWAAMAQPDVQDNFAPAGFDGARYNGYELTGVSCRSSNYCVAVGFHHEATAPPDLTPLVELWDGRSWSVDRYPGGVPPRGGAMPFSNNNPSLQGVSCTSGAPCTAVGTVANWCNQGGAGESCTLEAVQAGATWHTEPYSVDYASLNAVSCGSPNSCIAVGERDSGLPLILRWTGTSWSLSPAPAPG